MYLFDCGEGTQRQMMRYGVGFTVRAIYVSHMHADHYLGIVGLLRTMSLQGYAEPLRVHTPPGGASVLSQVMGLELEELSFFVEISDLEPGASVVYDGYAISAFLVDHPGGANGYVLREDARPGRFHPDVARSLGVPEGPLFGRLQRGEPVRLEDGREIRPDQVMGPSRSGRTLVYTGDTRPCVGTLEAAAGCDLLIHEATFTEEERERAARTGHSTARQAGEVARRAQVRQLALTHFSARYSERSYLLEREASQACGGTCEVVAAHDGLTLEVPYPD